jgi:type IV pilus assembly protein PilB
VSTAVRRRRLGELLIEAQVLDETRLKAALQEQKKWGGKLGRTLVEMGFITEAVMVQALSKQLNLGSIDLDNATLPASVPSMLRVDLCERYGVFPVGGDARTRTLNLATSDPTNVEALSELSFATNAKIVAVVSTASSIDRAIRRYYYGESTVASKTATPAQLGLKETNVELDELLGVAPQKAAPAPVVDDGAWKKEIALLREEIEALDKSTAAQTRGLRALVELLIESGLISREDYLAKLHKPD